MSFNPHERDILQLLSDYMSYHAGFGGAISIEDSHLRTADYGPAGFIQAGAEFEWYDRKPLTETYALLEDALSHLKRTNFPRWFVLRDIYLEDPADPSLVDHWRRIANTKPPKQKKRTSSVEQAAHRDKLASIERCQARVGLHDKAITTLAEYLVDADLHVVYPARMTSREEKQVDARNDEVWRTYSEMRKEGLKKTTAVKNTALISGYSERRVWDIVALRERSKSA